MNEYKAFKNSKTGKYEFAQSTLNNFTEPQEYTMVDKSDYVTLLKKAKRLRDLVEMAENAFTKNWAIDWNDLTNGVTDFDEFCKGKL